MALKQKLAELVVEINAKLAPLKGQLAKANAMLKRGFKSMVRMAKRAAIAIGVAFAAGIGWAIKLAMAAQESEALFGVAMGGMAKSTRKWSDQFAKSLRLNAFEVRKFVGTLNMMLKSMGLNKNEAAEMSQKMVELAYDISSAHDILPTEAFAKIRSGLVGMSRPLIELGYDLRETAVQQYALRTGMIESGEQLTATQKVLARYGHLLAVTGIAQGDLARTMGSATNVIRALKAQIVEAAIQIGIKLIPRVQTIGEKLLIWIKANKTLIASKIGDWVDALSAALEKLKPHLEFLAKHPKAIIRTLGLLIAIPIVGWFAAGARAAWLFAAATLGAAKAMASAKMVSLWPLGVARGFVVGKGFEDQSKIIQKAGIALASFRYQIKNMPRDLARKFRFLWAAPGLAAKGAFAWLLIPLKKAGGLIAKLVIAIKGITLATAAGALATVAVLAGIVAGIAYIVYRLGQWAKALLTIWKHRDQLGKQMTFEERAQKAAASRENREIRRKKMLIALAKKKADIDKKAAKEAAAEAAIKAESDRIAALKTAEEIQAIKDTALEGLRVLRDYYEKVGGYEVEKEAIDKTLRLQEAADITKVVGGDALKRFRELEAKALRDRLAAALLAAKETPVDIARAGLVGLQAAWGQIATGTQRTQEEQLRALERIVTSVERQEEIAETAGGLQVIGTPRY